VIYFMSQPEGAHHFRDVFSLMEISRVFPHGHTQVRFSPVNPGITGLESPAPGEGIVILGRPSHFRSDLIQKWMAERLFPPLQFCFDSDELGELGYRTLRCLLAPEKNHTAPNGRESLSHADLEDYALVYLGQARIYENEEASPCLILSGTSTLGTWAGSVFATSPHRLDRHVGHSPWFQGVLSAALRLPAPGAPFQRANLTLQVTDPFFRACWVEIVYSERAAEKEWRRNVDFQVLVNDRMVGAGFDNWRCFIALALEQQERPGQFIQAREVEARLRQAFAPPSLVGVRPSLNVPARLYDVAEQLCRHGVYIEKTPAGYRLLLAGFEETVT
jgi:hypothetical protein